MATDWTKKKEYRQLKKDLLEDLEGRGLTGKMYTDKVEEYMGLWVTKKMLEDDVKQRGVYIEYQNGANQKGTTENKSLALMLKTSTQMLNIWTALGFRERAKAQEPAPEEIVDEL